MKQSSSVVWLFLMGLSLFGGAFLLATPPEQLNGSVLLASGLLFVLAVVALVQADSANVALPAGWDRGWIGRWRVWWGANGRSYSFWAAWLIFIYILARLPQLQPTDSYRGVALGWGMAGLLYLYAIAGWPRQWPDWAAIGRTHWREISFVVGLTLVGLGLRVWHVATIPYTLGGDEASQGLEAVRVLNGQLRNPFVTGWLGVPTMSFFFNSLTIGLLGQSVFALRLPWVLVGAATIPTTYFLVRRLSNKQLAMITAVLLTVYHYHIHYSRLGSNQIADPFFLSLSLLFMYRGLDRRSRGDWAISGMVAGLALYFYAGARLTLVVITAVLLYHLIRQIRTFWREQWRGMLALLGGFLIVAGPMMQYAYRFPDNFNARLNQVGIIQSGWLANEVVVRGQPQWQILADQFQRAVLAFHVYPDRTVWYGLREPLLSPLFGALLALGLGYGMWLLVANRPGPRLAPLVVWWWGGVVLGGVLTESPPSSQRLITLAVPVCLFIAFALQTVSQRLAQAWATVRERLVVGGFVGLFAVSSLAGYFFDYTPKRIYGGPNAEVATAVAPRLQTLQYDHTFYFVGAPWMYWGFATLPYLLPAATAQDLHEPLDTYVPMDVVNRQQGAVFIVTPMRQDELQALFSAYPDGVRESFYSPVDGRLLAELYVVRPGDGE